MAKKVNSTRNKPRLTAAGLSQEVEAGLSAFINVSTEGFVLLDENLNYMFINPVVERMLGVSGKEVVGKNVSDVVPDVKESGRYDKYLKVLKTGEPIYLEDVVSHTKFRDMHLSIKAFRVGNWLGLIASDISKRKRVEEALRRSEEYFHSLTDNALDVVLVIGDDGVRKYVSPSIERVRGYKPEELIGKEAIEGVHPDDVSKVADIFVWLIENPGNPLRWECRLRHKDGSWRTVEGISRNLLDNAAVAGIVSNFRDITERKRMEETLSESEEKYRNLFNNAQVGLFRSRISDGKILECNDLLASMFGYQDREECIARHITSEHYVDPNVREQELAQMLEKGKVENLEALVTRKDGSSFWISYSATIYRERDYIEGVVIDITERKKAEEALTDSEKRYRTIVELAPDCIVTTDMNGVVISINPAFIKLTGFSEDEIVGKHFSELPTFRAVDIPRYMEMFISSKTKEVAPEPFEFIWVHKDGSLRWGEIHTSLMYSGGGLVGSQLIARDITERKQAEEALRESEGKWRSLTENSPDHIMLLGLDLTILFINRTVPDLTKEEVIGTPNFKYIPPEYHQTMTDCYKRVAASGKPDMYTTAYHTKGGESRYFEVRIVPVSKNGQVVGFISTSTDITERKKAEEALHFTRFALDNADAEMVCVNQDARYIDANDTFCRSVGYSREEVLSMTAHDIDPNYSAKIWPEFWEKLKRSGSLTFESCHRRKDGRVFPVEVTVTFFKYKGKEYHCGFARDITERKKAEEQLQASLREKDVLLREVNHRVKNNFQLISSLLDMIGMRARHEETIRLCASVHARVHAMALIHTQLYKSGSFAQADMGAHAGELFGYLAQVYATNGRIINLAMEPSYVHLPITQAVPCALALNEVVSNAFKHAFEGRSKGTIEISMKKSADGTVTLRVKDDGVGIAEGFDIDKASTLGLKLTRNLVQDQLNGVLQIKRDKGTEVIIEFKT